MKKINVIICSIFIVCLAAALPAGAAAKTDKATLYMFSSPG